MIRNQFDGFDNELDLVELSKRISKETDSSARQFARGTFGAASELTGMTDTDLVDVAAAVNNATGRSAMSSFASVMPTSLRDDFFVDRTAFQSTPESTTADDASSWVETRTFTKQAEGVTPTYNKSENSSAATGDSEYLDAISELMGGLSADQLSVIRSLFYTQAENTKLYVSESVSGVTDADIQNSETLVGATEEIPSHPTRCTCPNCYSARPQGLGNGGDDDDQQNDFAPVVSAIDRTIEMGRFLNVTSFFDYYDYDGNAMTALRVIDRGENSSSGYWFYNGARVQSGQWIEVPVAHLDRLRFYAGAVEFNEAIGIMVSDGKFWSTADFSRVITVPANDLKPTATGYPGTILSGESVKFQDYIQANDPENNLLKMRIIDRINNVNSGYFSVNGVAQTQGQWFEIDVNQLSQVDYYGAKNAQAEYVAFQVFDGKYWSNVANFLMTTTFNYYRPVVNAAEVTLDTGSVIQVGKWLTFSDADGSTAKKFRFYDTGARADGGYFTVNGVVQTAQVWFEVLAKDLDSVQYHAATNADFEKFRVMAYDSRYWSDIATGSVTVKVSPTTDMPDTLVGRPARSSA